MFLEMCSSIKYSIMIEGCYSYLYPDLRWKIAAELLMIKEQKVYLNTEVLSLLVD